MLLFNKDEETKILELLESIKNDNNNYYGIYFYFSKLEERNRNNFQIKIAINIIKDFFRNSQGCISHFSNNDIAIVFASENSSIIEKIIFQLRYLFIDDLLAFETKGVENHKFSSVYMLSFQWHDFYMACNNQKLSLDNPRKKEIPENKSESDTSLNIADLYSIQDISRFIRTQNIYGYNMFNNLYSPIYKEIYVNLHNFKDSLNYDSDIFSNKHLNRFLFSILNHKLLKSLINDPNQYLSETFSINLTIDTILSEEFPEFVNLVKESEYYNLTKSAIIELHISEIFDQPRDYLIAKKLLDSVDFKLSIKGLSDELLQFDRDKIHADLFKIYISPENIYNNKVQTHNIQHMIESVGANRIILYKCHDEETIKYGKNLGIKLFQGRYIDKYLNNNDINQNLVNDTINSKWELYKN